jgi:hypothetical protein
MCRDRAPSSCHRRSAAGLVIALLNRLDRIAHVADRLRQAAGQAPRQQEGEQQGEQREDAGLDQDSCWRWLKASLDMPTITRPR